jgi:hypothetical protein
MSYRVPSACLSVSAFAPEQLEQIVHRARTAFLYHSGHRLEACSICYGIRAKYHFERLIPGQTDPLPAAA